MKEKILTKEEIQEEARRYEAFRSIVMGSISVVIQGKVFGAPGDGYEKQLTLQCIESVRNFLPKAEIILSTWEGSMVDHLNYDKILFNADPGAVAYSDIDPTFLNNNNRQIISTYNGLKSASKIYVLKMRGDCKLVDTDFIYYLKDFPRGPQYNFFKQRIVIPTKYTRNPRRIAQLIHPSDIFQAGLLEDLLKLWNVPLQPEPQTTRAFSFEKKIFNNALRGGIHRMKFGAEQYIWYAFCKLQGLDLELKHYSHIPVNKILASDMSIVNNFVIQDALRLGVILPKKMVAHHDEDLYTHQEWFDLSLKYCKGTSKLYEAFLIYRVYQSNVLNILWRAQHRLFKFGIGNLIKTAQKYVRSSQ